MPPKFLQWMGSKLDISLEFCHWEIILIGIAQLKCGYGGATTEIFVFQYFGQSD